MRGWGRRSSSENGAHPAMGQAGVTSPYRSLTNDQNVQSPDCDRRQSSDRLKDRKLLQFCAFLDRYWGCCMAKKILLAALGLIGLGLVAAKLLLPSYVTSPQQARERILRQDLRVLNAVITQYTLDKQLPPHSLDDLVVAGYLKEVLQDPMTGRKDTWTLKCSSNPSRRGIVGIDSGYKTIPDKRTFHCD